MPKKKKKIIKAESLKKQSETKNKSTVKLKEEIEFLKEKNIKLLAEFDNFQRRSFNEKEIMKKYQGIDLLKDLLSPFDDINRTVEFNNSKDNDSVIEAIKLINSKIGSILKKYSIIRFQSINKDFDPTLHEALLEESSEKIDQGKIIEEYESGYTYHDKIIRHAKVVVSKGKP